MYQIAIIDDKLPYDINSDASDKPFQSYKIEEWLNVKDWGEEVHLKTLIDRIVTSDLYKHKEIELIGFLYPAALLKYISGNKEPSLIIFDWEYQTRNQDTKKQLVEIINKTKTSFIFVYTAEANKIWQLLIGEVIERNLNRLQLLLKGDSNLSLFTSEDNIMQFIISQFKKAYEFNMGKNSVRFEENKFLNSPADILRLESILGREYLLKKLKESNFEISDRTIDNIFNAVEIKLFLSNDNKYLLDSNVESVIKKYGPLSELTLLDALSKFGINIIDKVLERGIVIVN